MSLSSKHVILVDKDNKVLGILDKNLAHNSNTHLHRGFSVFLFNTNTNLLLLQKRSHQKKTWPNFWSNSFCGHPQINESDLDAIIRHAEYELNLKDLNNIQLLYSYRYRFTHNNIVENEICPIYIAHTNTENIIPNNDEIAQTQWIKWENFLEQISGENNLFTPWCIEETELVNSFLIKQGTTTY